MSNMGRCIESLPDPKKVFRQDTCSKLSTLFEPHPLPSSFDSILDWVREGRFHLMMASLVDPTDQFFDIPTAYNLYAEIWQHKKKSYLDLIAHFSTQAVRNSLGCSSPGLEAFLQPRASNGSSTTPLASSSPAASPTNSAITKRGQNLPEISGNLSTISEESVLSGNLAVEPAEDNAYQAVSASGPKVLKACGPQRLQSGKKQTNISTESLWGPEAMISNEDPAFDIYHDPQRLMDKSKADRAKRQPTEKSNPASWLHNAVDKRPRSKR